MKKKVLTLFLAILFCSSSFAQLFEKSHYSTYGWYKKHYSHNIEAGIVDGIQKEFVVGNNTDFLTQNFQVYGQSVTGNVIGIGVQAQVFPYKVALTDFTVLPTSDNRYAVGTGIYYPSTSNLSGFPFLGIYDRRTMTPINLYYYDLSYPTDKVDKNSVGLRIKYSERNNSIYISGVLCENVLPQMNMHELVGKSQGFILKIDFANPGSGQALVFDPDDISLIPILCAVTDLEIDANEQEIIFTGINTKSSTTGFYSPFAGKIDMNLGLQWSRTFSFGDDRFSGVDVEYSANGNFLMLMNCDKYDFAVMELSNLGAVIQQPVKYTFTYGNDPGPWPARSHIMHYNKGKILITGNLFEAERLQHLYSYEIVDATNLLSGNTNFQIYSSYTIPLGKQSEATTYWAPENSVLLNNYLSIVGIYNNIGSGNTEFGFCLVHQAGYDYDQCGDPHGVVTMTADNCESNQCTGHPSSCRGTEQLYVPGTPFPNYHQLCPTHDKSMKIELKEENKNSWEIDGINDAGIVLSFNNADKSNYLISVYNASGTRVHSEKVSINGQKTVYLKFQTADQIYLVNVNDGKTSETKKVAVIH